MATQDNEKKHQLYTIFGVKAYAEHLGVSTSTVRRLIKAGHIIYMRPTQRIQIYAEPSDRKLLKYSREKESRRLQEQNTTTPPETGEKRLSEKAFEIEPSLASNRQTDNKNGATAD